MTITTELPRKAAAIADVLAMAERADVRRPEIDYAGTLPVFMFANLVHVHEWVSYGLICPSDEPLDMWDDETGRRCVFAFIGNPMPWNVIAAWPAQDMCDWSNGCTANPSGDAMYPGLCADHVSMTKRALSTPLPQRTPGAAKDAVDAFDAVQHEIWGVEFGAAANHTEAQRLDRETARADALRREYEDTERVTEDQLPAILDALDVTVGVTA